jgi:hypothetical protein
MEIRKDMKWMDGQSQGIKNLRRGSPASPTLEFQDNDKNSKENQSNQARITLGNLMKQLDN